MRHRLRRDERFRRSEVGATDILYKNRRPRADPRSGYIERIIFLRGGGVF
jgi:hypothetical protein